jgi:hypothetical protein
LLRASIAGEAFARGERARELGRQARDRINTDFNVDDPDTPPRASQKLIAAATLLRAMPAPSTSEARNLHREAQALIEQAAVQQAESSASRIRQQGSARDDGGAQGPKPSVHAGGAAERPANLGCTPTKERLLNTRGQVQDGDARNVINARRAGDVEARAGAGYHPRWGGRYDSRENRSPTPEPPGTRVFSREIRTTNFPQRFRQPTTIVKYNGETDPRVWLNDYRLACQLGGATSNEVIIRNLPLHLADSARTWLEHLSASQIHNWDDLVRTFVGNFQGTYVRPGNSWDLRSCTQKPGESLRDFIRRFSKRCTELPSVAQSEIVHAFLEGTTCRDLVRELGRSPPIDSNELFDIASSFASGEEAVGAIFDGKKGKRVDDAPAEGSKSKEPRQKNKWGKKGKKPRHEAREQGHDNNDGKALAVHPARRDPRPAPQGPGVFDDMLKKPCPYHKTLVNHTLEQCDMLKRFYNRAAAKGDEAKKDGGDGDAGGFPAMENVFLIFGGATVDMSSRQCKRERHEVLVAEKAPPSFLDWSEDAITFSREDHLNRIPNPGQYPLVVDPVIGNAWFSKVLMDGGSNLNILYAHTLCMLGIGLDQLRPSTTPFHGVVPGKRVQPLGQIDLPVWFGTPDNYRKETLTSEVVGFKGAYHAILGRPCYAKFMAVPNYTYLKMKMPGPNGVITVGSSIEHAFDCDDECVEHAEALALDEALVTNMEKMVNEDLDSAAKHAGSFKASEQTKVVPLDPAAPEGKALRVSSTLDPK